MMMSAPVEVYIKQGATGGFMFFPKHNIFTRTETFGKLFGKKNIAAYRIE